jgi:hypothetical protein
MSKKKPEGVARRSEQGRWFRPPRLALSPRHPPELLSVLPHDRSRRFEPDTGSLHDLFKTAR